MYTDKCQEQQDFDSFLDLVHVTEDAHLCKAACGRNQSGLSTENPSR
jgi:hypothetical protein